MNARRLRLLSLVAVAVLAPAGAWAQGRGGGPPQAAKPGIDIATAKKAVPAAVAAANAAQTLMSRATDEKAGADAVK